MRHHHSSRLRGTTDKRARSIDRAGAVTLRVPGPRESAHADELAAALSGSRLCGRIAFSNEKAGSSYSAVAVADDVAFPDERANSGDRP